MQNSGQADEILVQENLPLHLRHAATIHCTAGMVWITAPGEKQDVFLAAGQSHCSQGHGLTLIEGVGKGWIRLENNEQATVRQGWQSAARQLWRKLFSRTGRVASAPDWFA